MNPGDGQVVTLLAGAVLGLLMTGIVALIILAVRAAVAAADKPIEWPDEEEDYPCER